MQHLLTILMLWTTVLGASTQDVLAVPNAALVSPEVVTPVGTPQTETISRRDLQEATTEITKRINEVKEGSSKKYSDWAALAAAVVALLSLFFNFYQYKTNLREAEKHRDSERQASQQAILLDSLKWFEGGTQKRNIGISIIEGHWDKFPELHPTWVWLLLGQVKYLIFKLVDNMPEHEQQNLDKVLLRLSIAKEEPHVKKMKIDFRKVLDDAFQKAENHAESNLPKESPANAELTRFKKRYAELF